MNDEESLNISLIDTGFYSSSYSFYEFFHRNKITMLNQLFDEELIKNVLKNCKSARKKSIYSFINFMKCVYLNEPLDLGKSINTIDFFETESVKNNIPKHVRAEQSSWPEYNFIYHDKCILEILPFNNKERSPYHYLNKQDKPIKLIDYLKICQDTKSLSVVNYNINNFLIKYYEKIKKNDNTNIEIGNDKTYLNELKNQLKNLKKIRENIDSQINSLEKIINESDNMTLKLSDNNIINYKM